MRPMLGRVSMRLGVQHFGVRRVRRFDQRRVGRDGDRFLDGADFERDVEGDELLRADADAAALEGLEALHRRLDGVARRIERRERVLARRVRDRVARDAVGLVDQRDRDAGNHALRVLDRAAHAALERLGERHPGRRPRQTDSDDYRCEKLPLDSHTRPPKTTQTQRRTTARPTR